MLKRTLTGLVIALITALMIASRYLTIYFFDFFVMLISYIATYEVLKVYIKKDDSVLPIKNRSYIILSLIYCYMVYMCYSMAKTILYAIIYQLVSIMIILIVAFIIDIVYLAKLRKAGIEIENSKLLYSTKSTLQIALYPITLLGTLYGFGIVGMDITFGTVLVITIFAVTMLTDVFAYLFGMAFHKGVLASQISPKKSISGAVGGLFGGLVGATTIFCICNFALKTNPFAGYELWRTITFFSLVGLFGSIITQIGDLFASYLKRNAGIKDFGNIFPGHGGMMDRLDGLMFTSTLTFILMALIFII